MEIFESSALFGILTPFQFLQDQLVDLVDIAAAQCDYQVSRLCVVADILCHLVEVLILALVSGLGLLSSCGNQTAPGIFSPSCRVKML